MYRAPYRVEYVDENGNPQWSEPFCTYQEASIAAALLKEAGATIRAIFSDAGSAYRYPSYNKWAPPRWLDRL